ncbi:hypothetical protein GCM10009733_085730 [Nonomuraea maheshkhaliensis]|uniref:Uncharacterized protein n=1 Tax=Nonomuraea maheshkhaliensis TaxID=419590 RepID=A0ABN2GSP3_9ACTN
MYTRMTACPGTSGPVWLRLPDEEMTTQASPYDFVCKQDVRSSNLLGSTSKKHTPAQDRLAGVRD